jgi:hypothetical protein
MKLRLPPVLIERERLIARVIDDDDGFARVETWTGSNWARASYRLFLEVFRAPPATAAQLLEQNVAPTEQVVET